MLSFDIKCGFLQGKEIDKKVYVKPPCELDNEKILKLNRTIYGLKGCVRSIFTSSFFKSKREHL